MKKLIELLNEYENVNDWYATYTIRGEDSKRELKSSYMFDEDKNAIQNHIISKSFGFIERLVNSDKIELREDLYLEDQHGGGFSKYENILMYLAISQNPIEDLISYLK